MSADIVVCPHCRTNLQNSEAVAGQVVACPQCQTQLQMPALTQSTAAPQLPSPASLPPAVELPPAIEPNNSEIVGSRGSGPLVQTERKQKGAARSAYDRIQKRPNPLLICFVVIVVIILIGAGAASLLWSRAEKERRRFADQMVGNWELMPGQSQLERWDFAFHSDHKLQMALGNQLSEGHWKVTSVNGTTGYLLINWPDEAPETMRVRFESGMMQVHLDSVGSFAFRAAVP